MSRASDAALEGVKSASRAMAILELFRDYRRPISAREIASALGMPRSSTNVLLRSLILGNYLRYDETTTAYFPTLRVFQLGSWLIDGFLHSPEVEAVMQRLADTTQETVCLWTQIGTAMSVVSVIDSPQAISLTIKPGATAPVFGSAVGLALLARLEPSIVDQLHERWLRSSAGSGPQRLDLIERIDLVRCTQGISVGYDFWLPDAAAVASAFVHPAIGEMAVLAVGGPVFRVRRNEEVIVEALREATRQLTSPSEYADV